MDVMLFGVGAAGNKAALTVLKNGVLDNNHIRLLNTTLKDIPEEVKSSDMILKFSSMLGGCGKEPAKGKAAILKAIKERKVNLGSVIYPETRAVFIVTSTEGGTGCGATPIIAKFYEAMNIPVHVFALIGFQDEVRGISNTLKFFKELSDSVVLHTIQNSKFLDYTQSYTKAELAANEEFSNQVEVLIGSRMVPSSQNIDDTDHYKIMTTPGCMDIQTINLAGVKNVETFNKAVQEKFDNLTCFEYNRGCKRLAVIINASEKVQDSIDNRFEVIKRYTGEPFEIFRHIQNSKTESGEWMHVIVAGLAYPEEGIIEVSKKYSKARADMSTSSKGFDDIFGNIDFDDDGDDEFNSDIKQMANPDDITADFLESLAESAATKEPKSSKNSMVRHARRASSAAEADGMEAY